MSMQHTSRGHSVWRDYFEAEAAADNDIRQQAHLFDTAVSLLPAAEVAVGVVGVLAAGGALVIAPTTVAILRQVVAAAHAFSAQYKQMTCVEQSSAKLMARLTATMQMLGLPSFQTLIDEDAETRAVVAHFVEIIYDACAFVKQHTTRCWFLKFRAAPGRLLALEALDAEITQTFQFVLQYATFRTSGMQSELMKNGFTKLERLVDAIEAEGAIRIAASVDTAEALEKIARSIPAMADEVKDALTKETAGLHQDVENARASIKAHISEMQLTLYGVHAQQYRARAQLSNLSEANAVMHSVTHNELDALSARVDSLARRLPKGADSGGGGGHGGDDGRGDGGGSGGSGGQPTATVATAGNRSDDQGTTSGDGGGGGSGDQPTSAADGGHDGGHDGAATATTAASPSLADHAPRHDIVQLSDDTPLAEQFDAVLAFRKEKGENKNTISKLLGYSGKSGSGDLNNVRNGRSSIVSLADAVYLLRWGSRPPRVADHAPGHDMVISDDTPLAEQFDAVLAFRAAKNENKNTISKFLGYSGKCGSRDLKSVRADTGRAKISLADAVHLLRWGTRDSVPTDTPNHDRAAPHDRSNDQGSSRVGDITDGQGPAADDSRGAASLPRAPSPAVSDNAPKDAIEFAERTPLAAQFDAILDYRKKKGESKNTISKFLGYSGTSGTGDVKAVQEGRSTKISLADAVHLLRWGSHPSVPAHPPGATAATTAAAAA